MSDLTPLLREAADALWLIPMHAGLAQRLTHAAERTRPSEAEVTDAMVRAYRQARTCPESVELANDDEAFFAHIATCKACIRLQLAAALSTPPLPSAEPVAWPLADEDGRKGGWTYDFAWLERIADEVADEDNGRPCPEIVEGIALRLARTTPPAAAQDTGDDDDSFLADAAPTLLGQLSRKAVQAAVDEATDADGWVRFVDGQVVSRNALLNKLVALDSDAARAAGGE